MGGCGAGLPAMCYSRMGKPQTTIAANVFYLSSYWSEFGMGGAGRPVRWDRIAMVVRQKRYITSFDTLD